jgi:hypothetical protein
MDAAEMAYLTEMCERLTRYGALASEAHQNGEEGKAQVFEQKQSETLTQIQRHFGIAVR